ncbi:MAG: hypothetical protein JW982_09105 [Spirochaetes bacterium]|nr:hypothetical protein [Spirochaetota bacterium]
MNKILKYLAYVSLCIFFCNDFLSAQENISANDNTETENSSPVQEFAKYSIGERLFGGITYPGGTLSGYETPERKLSYNYGIAVTFEYRFNAFHSFTSDLALSRKDYYIRKSIAGDMADIHYRFDFIDIHSGYRFNYNSFFAGIGFFAGYSVYGLMYTEVDSLAIGEIDKSAYGINAGMFIETGYRFILNGTFDFVTGINYDLGFTSYYSDEDELMTNSGSVFAELVYKL